MNHANNANYFLQRERKKKIEGRLDNIDTTLADVDNPELKSLFEEVTTGFKAVFVQDSEPMILDFYDIQAIAYAVGTYHDGGSWLRKTFIAENPLDARVREHSEHYETFKQTGNLTLDYFDEEILPDLRRVTEPKAEMNLRAESWDEAFKKSCEYINRQGALLRLADSRDVLNEYYLNES